MKKMILTLAATMAVCAAHAQAEQYRVVAVIDGDTVRVLSPDKRQMKCRMFGIDAPEKSQSHGQASKASLSDMIYGKTVEVNVVDQDQYGRSVCRIFLNGVDVNKAQIQRGLAWWYSRYSKDAAYRQAQDAARQQRLGLWAESNPTPPWSFRRSERSNNF